MRKIDPPLPPPINCRQARIAGEHIHKIVSESDFLKFLEKLDFDILHPDQNTNYEKIWNNFVLAQIARGNFCSDDALTAICHTTVEDILPVLDCDYTFMPRINSTIPFGAPQAVKMAAVRLLAQVGMRTNQRHLPILLPNPGTYLFPNLADPFIPPDQKSIREWIRRFDKELLRRTQPTPFGAKQFLALSQNHTLGQFPLYVSGYLTGTHIINPVIPSSSPNLLEAFRHHRMKMLPPPLAPKLIPIKKSSNRKEQNNHSLEKQIKALLKITHPYRKISGEINKNQVRNALRHNMENWLEKNCSIGSKQSTTLKNCRLVGLWLNSIANKSPNTLAVYQSGINQLLRQYPDTLLSELTYSKIIDYLNHYESNKSKEGRASAINSLRQFITKKLERAVNFPPINFGENFEIRPYRLITPLELEKIIQLARSIGPEGEYVAVSNLLGSFGGMRLNETATIKLRDFFFEINRITLSLKDSKRNPHKWIYLVDLPTAVYEFLHTFWKHRKSEEDNLDTLLLGEKINPNRLRHLNRRIFDTLAVPGSHRDLRNFWVNRLLARGWSLIDIGHMAGHKSLETTVSSYSHIAPLLHIQHLQMPGRWISVAKIGVLLGFSNRAVRKEHLGKNNIKITEVFQGNKKIHMISPKEASRFICGVFSSTT